MEACSFWGCSGPSHSPSDGANRRLSRERHGASAARKSSSSLTSRVALVGRALALPSPAGLLVVYGRTYRNRSLSPPLFPQDLSGGLPVRVTSPMGGDLPLWGLQLDPEQVG